MQTAMAMLLRCRRPLGLLFRGYGVHCLSPADSCLRSQRFVRPLSVETRPSEASAPVRFSLLERAGSHGDVHFDGADAKSRPKDETCISKELGCVGTKQQLTLESLGFTEDGEELQTSKKTDKMTTLPRTQKRVVPIKDLEGKKDKGKGSSFPVKDVKSKVDKGNHSDSLDQLVEQEPPLQQQVWRTASPEEMKKVALEASDILAKVAGVKSRRVDETRTKKIAVKQPRTNGFSLSSDAASAAKECLDEKTTHSNVSSVSEGCSGAVEESEGTLEDTRPDSNVSRMSQDCSADVAESKEDLEENRVDKTPVPEFKHPWPEWIEFLQFLYAGNFFAGMETWTEEGKSVFETGSCVRTASTMFGRNRGDVFRFQTKSLTKKDLKVIANYGCPTLDTKASNASKRLRTFFRIPEGEVCQRCSLKMSCPRAFLDPPKDTSPDPRTLDVVRIITGFAVNALPSEESFMSYPGEVETSVRRILQEILTFGALPRDPSFVEKAPEVKQAREAPSKSKQEKLVTAKKHRDDVMMMLGDWTCPNCNFMNFAKNKNCRECNVSRPPQQLLSGEWQCPKCRYVNFERNLQCRECGTECPLVYPALSLKTKKVVNLSSGHEKDNLDEKYSRTELRGAKKSSDGRHTGQNDNVSVSDADWESSEQTLQRPRLSRRESSCSVGSHPVGMSDADKRKGSSISVSCNNVQKLNLSRRKVSIQQVLESDYEASQEETDSDFLDFLDIESSDSDMDLSGEEGEALSRLEFQVQGGKNSKAIFRWLEDEEAKANASPSQKGMTQMTNVPRSCKVSKSKDAKLSSSSSHNQIGKCASKGSVIDGEGNKKAAKAINKRDLKATKSGLQQASKMLFSWSDSDADDSDSKRQRNLQEKADSRRKVFGSKRQHTKGKR